MPVELFTNEASTTVSSGGTIAPASGTTETWTVASSATFPAASNAASPPTQFHVADPAQPGEIIAVTNVSGTTWTVTRGAESSATVAHSAGFAVQQVVSAAAYSGFLQAANNLTDVGTRQTALNNLAGAVTSGRVLRGDGTNVTLAAIQAGDLPTGTTSAKGALQLDGTASDIQAVGTAAAAGSSGLAADARHVHAGIAALQATTGASGFNLANSTGTIISWTAPNDGALHRVMIFGELHVTSTETGGRVDLLLTLPDGTASTKTMFAAAQSTAVVAYPASQSCPQLFLIEANTTVSISQGTALTGGAAVMWAELWAS
jgi:hypothetical protein